MGSALKASNINEGGFLNITVYVLKALLLGKPCRDGLNKEKIGVKTPLE